MNTWPNAVLTNKGRALMAKLTQGNTLNITKAYTGAGFVDPELLDQQLDVTNKKQTIKLHPASYPEAGKCAITVALSNEGLYTGYAALQVGIYATDPDEGEILLLIAQAADERNGTIVPSETEMPGFSSDWTFYLQYGQADSVNVTVDPAGAVSRDEMEGYVGDNSVAIKHLKAAMPGGSTPNTRKVWNSIAYGNGMFVAVGESAMAISTDGVSWTSVENTLPRKWKSVTYGNGMFVAVSTMSNPGSLGTQAYSYDGINWEYATTPITGEWRSVTYGLGMFVAVATPSPPSACSAYSTDGINWTAGSLSTEPSWTSIAYGNGVFVAAANSSTAYNIAYSTDGIDWTLVSDRWTYTSVAYGNGMFVAVSTTSAGGGWSIKYSTDGINWKHVDRGVGYYYYSSVTFGGGMFVALQGYKEPRDKVAISYDGLNWEEATLPISAYWDSIAYGNGRFVAMSGYKGAGTSCCVVFSDDGINWKSEEIFLEQGEEVVTPEHIGAAPKDHTHTPERIGAAPAYSYGTEDLEAGVSELKTGTLYFVYE